YGGVANYKASNVVNVSSGHVYHVISKGKGRMWGQAAQIRPVERWQIVHYVNQLRGYQGE
ncbi:MAG: cytochrome c, partial [Bacteroidota bacterium]